MIEDDREERLCRDAPIFDVAPVARRRGIPPALIVGVLVAVTAFAGGLAVASPGPDAVRRDTAAPVTAASSGGTSAGTGPAADPTAGAAAMPVQPTAPVTAGGPSQPTAAPGSSGFVAAFDPAAVLAGVAGGTRCEVGAPLEKQAPRTRADGPRLTFQRSWMVFCRIAPPERQAFLVDLFQALRPAIPADTYAYGTTGGGAGNALFPYADRPMAGTVAVHADAAGMGLAIVVVVEEWRTG